MIDKMEELTRILFLSFIASFFIFLIILNSFLKTTDNPIILLALLSVPYYIYAYLAAIFTTHYSNKVKEFVSKYSKENPERFSFSLMFIIALILSVFVYFAIGWNNSVTILCTSVFTITVWYINRKFLTKSYPLNH